MINGIAGMGQVVMPCPHLFEMWGVIFLAKQGTQNKMLFQISSLDPFSKI